MLIWWLERFSGFVGLGQWVRMSCVKHMLYSQPGILGCADFSWRQIAMSWFLCLFSVSLCGGNGLGGQCQCGTCLGLLDAKMFLITIYRPLPPSFLFPRLCVICGAFFGEEEPLAMYRRRV